MIVSHKHTEILHYKARALLAQTNFSVIGESVVNICSEHAMIQFNACGEVKIGPRSSFYRLISFIDLAGPIFMSK